MSSIFRIYNTYGGGKKLINLTKISSFVIKEKELTLTYENERNSISGGLFLFGGGNNCSETYTFNSSEDANKEFEYIKCVLDKYYKTNE